MPKGRLEAFSDGVLAIIITIMVLELRVPRGAEFAALRELAPVFGCYALSFINIGIYWNNHHHLFQVSKSVDGAVLWANLHLLFWLSLIPFGTAWMGENGFALAPVAFYGAILLMAGVAYWILALTLVHHEGPNSKLSRAIGSDFKGKISIAIYAAAIALSFLSRAVALAGYVLVALIWLIPDRRIEKRAAGADESGD